jgi:hypothetical protein
MKARPGFILTVIGIVLAVAASASAQMSTKKAPEPGNTPVETFTGFAVSVTSGQSGVVEIVINRWSTDGERQLLENVLKASGSQAMVRIMQDLPQVGYIKGSETMGDALFYARSNDLPDGTRQVVIATNRPISGAALLAPGAKNQYDATVIEMRFQKDSKKGQGKIVVAGKASIDPKTGKLHLNNYAGEPVRLENITVKTP